MKESILRHPDPRQSFTIETDASEVAIGGILLQRDPHNGALCPCTYHSRKLSQAEKAYTIWEKELLAIKSAFEVWGHHLEGANHIIEVRTHHHNLEHLKTARNLNQRQIRWSLFFSQFNSKVAYIPRGHNQRADTLSHKPEYEREAPLLPPHPVIPVEKFAAIKGEEDLVHQQRKDPFVSQQRNELK